ncbi:MAG: hypothetical protein FJ280_08120 [Planctomycetes bacterium]|nr:hypothetical protein [Planctomycetota bacterium]
MDHDIDDILNSLVARVHRVRGWLLALGVLKSAAVGLACLCAYVGLYAWIDHYAHLGPGGRLTALLVLVLLLAGLGWLLVRTLRRDMQDSHAAGYIEGRHSFGQQLVAAVEYFEGRSDYPYSRSLAARLVRQVDAAAREFRFDSVIDKWRHYVLAGGIVLGLSVVGLFISRNVLYLSCYLGRLVRPFAPIAPVPATGFESLTGDLVVACEAPLTLTAAVHGRTPESAALVLARADAGDANDAGECRRMEVNPTVDAQGNVTFSVATSFPTPGHWTYRFEAGGAVSEPHTIKVCEPPAVKSVTAAVSRTDDGGRTTEEEGGNVRSGSDLLPSSPSHLLSSPVLCPPSSAGRQPVQDGTLQVLPHSSIEFQVESTVPLREATAVTAGGQSQTLPLDGAQALAFRVTADQPSDIELTLVSADGVPSRAPYRLRVLVKADEPPQFQLLSPEGDYRATDVASVPIAFDVSDDFGLEAAELCAEFPDGRVIVLDSQSPRGATRVSVTHTLELEQYPVHVGDSILFYARAKDIDTGQRKSDAGASSEVYLIEIRSYRQYWHPQPGGGKPQPGMVPEDLTAILEYTRAILKKSWMLAQETPLTADTRSRAQTLAGEVRYCAERLARIRDDPDYGFSELAKAQLSRIVRHYEAAQDALRGPDAPAALTALKDAYRLLRQFVDELHLKWTPPQSGPSPPPPQERLRLQEPPPEALRQQQRAENQLQELQRRLEKLAREQKSLRADLQDALDRQPGAEGSSESGGSSSGSPSGRRSEPSRAQAPQHRSDPAAQETSRSDPQDARGEEMADGDSKQQAGQSAAAKAETPPSGASPSGQTQDATGQAGSQGDSRAEGEASMPGTPTRTADPQRSPVGESSVQGGPGEPAESQAPSSSTRQDGQLPDSSDQAQSQEGAGAEGAQGSAQTGGPRSNQDSSPGAQNGSGGSAEARLRMLEARQKALQSEAAQVQADLRQVPVSASSPHGQAREQAQGHVGRAVEQMAQFQEKLTETRYDPARSTQKTEEVSGLADSARRELLEAGKALRQGLSEGKPQTAGAKAREMAEQLAEDAEALDESLSPAERQRMLERLEAAKRLLERMAGPEWATVSGGGTPGGVLVYTKDAHTTPAETARMLARQFWSIALEAREKGRQPVADEPSDMEFFKAESDFFNGCSILILT